MRSTEVIGTRLPRSASDALKQHAAEANTSPGAVIRAALDAFKTPEVRAAVAQLAPEVRAALAPVLAQPRASGVALARRPQPLKHHAHVETTDLGGTKVLVTIAEADRLAKLRAEFGLNIPAGPERAKRAAKARAVLASRGEAESARAARKQSVGTRPAPDPKTRPAPAPGTRPAPSAPKPDPLAGLEDFERRDAAKIQDPEARKRFISKRFARRAKR